MAPAFRYERVGVYAIEEIMPQLLMHPTSFLGRSLDPSRDTPRYQLFDRSHTCAKCGIEGVFFALERNMKKVVVGQRQVQSAWGTGSPRPIYGWVSDEGSHWHFNLYGFDANEFEMMLTIDHVIPKSKGGVDTQENYQCLCWLCNNRKGSKVY